MSLDLAQTLFDRDAAALAERAGPMHLGPRRRLRGMPRADSNAGTCCGLDAGTDRPRLLSRGGQAKDAVGQTAQYPARAQAARLESRKSAVHLCARARPLHGSGLALEMKASSGRPGARTRMPSW